MHPRRRLRATRTLLAVAVALSASSMAAASAATRDVEVTHGSVADGRLTLLPAVAFRRDVEDHDTFPLAIVNGSDVPVTLELRIVTTEPDSDGVRPSAHDVPWARLPRDEVTVPAGSRADLEVAVSPAPGDLPAAISVLATTVGTRTEQAFSHVVLWPPQQAATVGVEIRPGAVAVTSDAPAVVDLRLHGAAAPLLGTATDVGPLVLLANLPRSIEFEAPRWLLGSRVDVVVAIDGAEVARASAGQSVTPLRALLAAALVALLAFLVLEVLRRRPKSGGRPGHGASTSDPGIS